MIPALNILSTSERLRKLNEGSIFRDNLVVKLFRELEALILTLLGFGFS